MCFDSERMRISGKQWQDSERERERERIMAHVYVKQKCNEIIYMEKSAFSIYEG